MDYAKEEAKLLTKINDQIEKLDINRSKMGSAENKLAHFADQEKALHDIKSIIRSENKIYKDEAEDVADSMKKETNIAAVISNKIDDLENRLNKLNDDDTKIKSYIEQKKAIADIKKIIEEALK